MHVNIADDIEALDKKVQELSKSHTQQRSAPDLSLNVVIRNLPETVNENITNKVNHMISKSLNIKDVTVKNFRVGILTWLGNSDI